MLALTTVTVAVIILSGCTGHAQSRSAPPTPVTPASSVPVANPGPPPPPEALTDVMTRLADPAVPGADKLPLLQNAAPPDAATLDRFSAALRDGGFSPVVFKAGDVHWADQPGDVMATVSVTRDAAGTDAASLPPGLAEQAASVDATPSSNPCGIRRMRTHLT